MTRLIGGGDGAGLAADRAARSCWSLPSTVSADNSLHMRIGIVSSDSVVMHVMHCKSRTGRFQSPGIAG